MTESDYPELGEPSETLKDDFRLIIDETLINGLDERSFPLENGRTLDVFKVTNEDDEYYSYCSAVIAEIIAGENHEATTYKTIYTLYQNEDLAKHLITQSLDPSVTAEDDQFRAGVRTRLQELEAMGFDIDSARKILVDERYGKLSGEEEKSYHRKLEELLLANEEEARVGLGMVSGVELQSIIDMIREVINNDQEE